MGTRYIPTIFVLSKKKKNKIKKIIIMNINYYHIFASENCQFYHYKKLQYIAQACYIMKDSASMDDKTKASCSKRH